MLEDLFSPKIYTINYFMQEFWLDYSSTLILGVVLLISIAILKYKFSLFARYKQALMMVILGLCSYHLACFWWQNLRSFNRDLVNRRHHQEKKMIVNVCEMDKAQGFDGVMCNVPKFLILSRDQMPADAKVKVLSAGYADVLLNYYGANYYSLVRGIEEADYLMVCYYPGLIELSDSGEVWMGSSKADLRSIGRWKKVNFGVDQIFILKKI